MGKSEAAFEAVLRLARRLKSEHNDRWALQLLRGHGNTACQAGIEFLAEAIQAYGTDRALDAAHASTEQFRQCRNVAGELRASIEELFALQRIGRAGECVARGREIRIRAEAAEFTWIAGQAALQDAICTSLAGDEGRAVAKIEDAMKLISAARYHALELRALGMLIDIPTNAGSNTVVWKRSPRALDEFWSSAYPAARAHQIYFSLSRVSERLGCYYSSLAFMRAAVDAIAATRYRSFEAWGRVAVARLAAATGDMALSQAEFARAEEIFHDLGPSRAVERDRADALLDRARGDIESGDAREVLRLVTEARSTLGSDATFIMRLRAYETEGRARLRLGQLTEANSALEAAVSMAAERANSLPRQERLESIRQSTPIFRLLTALELQADASGEHALQLWQWFRAGMPRPRPDRRSPKPVITAASGEVFLTYVVTRSALLIWAVSDRGTRVRAVPVGEREIQTLTARFLRSCSNPKSPMDDLRRDGRRLYEILLAPVADMLENARFLIVQPDGPLSGIPFPALVDEKSEFLSAQFAIEYAGDVAQYHKRVFRTISPSVRVLVVANPRLYGAAAVLFPPVADFEREASAVASKFSEAHVLLGNEANAHNLQAGMKDSELFHFAGHGYTTAENGSLVLAPAVPDEGMNTLVASQIVEQRWLNCRLAVLSACSTAAGETNGPVNPESLVRALLESGVNRVVASQWSVDTGATSELMSAFYLSLLRGSVPAQALREAAAPLRARPETAHPFYWSAFQTFCCS